MKRIFFIVIAIFSSYHAEAQTLGQVHLADSLHLVYDFEQAKDIYVGILDEMDPETDTLLFDSLREKILLAENGRNMSRFVQTPSVIAKKKFSLSDFFLYYPLADRSWRPVSSILDTLSYKSYARALYAPEQDEVIYYSASGESGSRDVMMTELLDTLWSIPVADTVLSTPASNEIYPLVSSDGKSIYFASDGLYGAGGYDIYMSSWDDDGKKWSIPQNAGFPYSSPANDFMYMETEDGRHILFASDRECSGDSVMVYVIRKEPYPVHIPVTDPKELMELARLDVPENEIVEEEESGIPDNELTQKYDEKVTEVKALRDSMAVSMADLDEMRNEYILSNDPGVRIRLTNKILELETALPLIQRSLDEANRQLREIEMEFLKEGIFMNMDISDTEEEDDDTSDVPVYEFIRMQMGDTLDIRFVEPESKFDYTFRVEEEAVFAEDQTIPTGTVYQIQLFSGGRKASVAELKGLCPVYEYGKSSGIFTYRVGLFRSHAEAAACVDTVRKKGFKDAYVVAFIDGEPVSVAKARENE